MDEPQPSTSRRHDKGGQSLVEFTLVLPILLVLLITVGDFGRIFATGVTIESAARAAAETAAIEYLREDMATAVPMTSAAYDRVHHFAWESVCNEADGLPNAVNTTGVQCDGLPTVVCVHDGLDPNCGNVYNAAGGIPAGCPTLLLANRPTNSQSAQSSFGTEASRWVEVRVCYRFSSIFSLTIPALNGGIQTLGGDFFVERVRSFTVADY